MNSTNLGGKKREKFFPSAYVLTSVKEKLFIIILFYFDFWESILRIFILVEEHPIERHIIKFNF